MDPQVVLIGFSALLFSHLHLPCTPIKNCNPVEYVPLTKRVHITLQNHNIKYISTKW